MTGLVALAALAAGAVIAFGSPSGGADAAATPSATAPAPRSDAPTATAEPSGPGSAASPSPAAGKAAGRVAHGVHTGDLRYFLIPPPEQADVYGDPAGSADTAADVAAGSADESQAQRALTTYGFRSAASRTYLTADGVSEVTVELVRLHGPSQAAAYYSASSYQATTLPLQGSYPARGYDLSSGSAESSDTLLAISYQGDVQITVSVTGGRTPSHTLLQHLLDAQYQRLKTGH
ncbi:hypothetical protein SAMN05216223_119131 [Actinacidiphila yanglinensis]|uniref:Uncharacterized protein n=1 Tax=Actinacidiphila yanglinensis TaxID=310779 RepID=A0A1H6DU11_9ACTN|nr:hypothetical protein [Actinacidiphila yanglinensis]SEG88740.1 hypothetical protein SAMN05216223_119131 [Actinacidiphila yanglinensis]